MKMPQAFLVCACLLGATQLAWGQTAKPSVPQIPGYLDPTTGKFTTQVASNATVQPQAALSGTSVFFREDFQVSIANFDQPTNSQVVCSVTMLSTSDSNGVFEELYSVPGTQTGSGWYCEVPVLTLWTLKTPATDTISASVAVTIYSQYSPTTTPEVYRQSTQSLGTLSVPANTQTIVNSVSFQL
jgi:hypothetical protein